MKSTTLLFFLIIPLVACSISASAVTLSVVASDTPVWYSNSSTVTISSLTPVTVYTHTVTQNVTGTQRYTWWGNSTNGSNYLSSIYINGAWKGGFYWSYNSDAKMTLDISQSLVVGDTIELKASTGAPLNGSFTSHDFDVAYTLIGNVVYGVAYTLVNGVEVPIEGAEVRLWNTSNLGNSSSMITSISGVYAFYNLSSGTYYLQALKGDEYDPSSTEIITIDGTSVSHKNILLAGCTIGQSCYANVVFPTFTVWNNTMGVPIEGASVVITKYNSSTPIVTETTGTDGQVSAKLSKNQRYNVTVTSPTNISQTGSWTGYPQQSNYAIPIGSGISGTQPFNGSVYTGNTSAGTAGGISNFTSSYLNSTLGIGLMGQGIIVGITSWFVVGAAGGIATLAVLFAYVYLGIISMVSLIVMAFTMISIYILRGKI